MTKADFRKLQLEWYAKLRRTGFVDIEGGRDLNAMHASTLPGVNRAGGRFHVPRTESVGPAWAYLEHVYETNGNLATHQTDRAEAWAYFAHRANDLKARGKRARNRKEFLLYVSEHGTISSGDCGEFGYTYSEALRVFQEFCDEIGIPRTHMLTRGNRRRHGRDS